MMETDWMEWDEMGWDWIGLDRTGLDWIGLDWIGLDWTGLEGRGWDGMGWDCELKKVLICQQTNRLMVICKERIWWIPFIHTLMAETKRRHVN